MHCGKPNGLVRRGRALTAAEARAKEDLGATSVDDALRDAAAVAVRWGRNPFAWLTATWRRARRALKAAVRPGRWKGTAAAGREVAAWIAAIGGMPNSTIRANSRAIGSVHE